MHFHPTGMIPGEKEIRVGAMVDGADGERKASTDKQLGTELE